MRLAVISDVHGNVHALDAVLDHIASQSPDAILNLGDNLAGPLDVSACADRLMSLGALSVRGNHDRWILDPGTGRRVDAFAAGCIAQTHRDWLSALPATAVFADEVLLCHGTPASDEEMWLDGLFDQRQTRLPALGEVEEKAAGLAHPVLLCGHSHMARAVRLTSGQQIVNPGSVGLQFVHGSPDARYAILDRTARGWQVSFHIVRYDWEGAARAAEANGFGHWRAALTTGWADPDDLF